MDRACPPSTTRPAAGGPIRTARQPRLVRRAAACAVAAALAAAARLAGAADGVVADCTEAGFAAVLDAVQGSGGGTITFDCGPSPVTIPITQYRPISGAVRIDGGGRVTFDAGHASAFFQVFYNASLHLERLVLERGTFDQVGALENFGHLRLDDVVVRGGEGRASALLNLGWATVANSTFENNRITADSYTGGAAISSDGPELVVLDSRFAGNAIALPSGQGGAIFAGNGTQLRILRSTFDGNSAPDGGAVYADTGTHVHVDRSTFTANTAGYGGAIETWSGDIAVRRSRFENNLAQTGDGGAIWAVAGALTVEYGQFTGNRAATTGGALSCYADVLTVSRSAFGSNHSGSHGGAIYTTCGFLVDNATFHANVADGAASGGGAIYHAGPMYGGVFFATLADNGAGYGAGIASQSSQGTSVHLFGSLLAGNAGGNCAGVLTSGGYNLSDDTHCGGAFTAPGDLNATPLALQPFADHGGPTWTRPPQAGSPAVDHVPAADCLGLAAGRFDQRGAARPANGACDSGAYETGGLIDAIFADGFEP
jgi:hypothetical protein